MQIKQRVHLPMKLCDQEGIWKTQLKSVQSTLSHLILAFFQEFFFRGVKIYCYANFFCYAIVFGPNFREGQKFSGGRPLPPCGRKPGYRPLFCVPRLPAFSWSMVIPVLFLLNKLTWGLGFII